MNIVTGGGHIASLFGCRVRGTLSLAGLEHIGPCPAGHQYHLGIDIAAPEGTPIHAVQQGVVLGIFHDGQVSGYGNMVVLKHTADDLGSVYAHMSRIDVRRGQRLWQGEQVGLVGHTDSGRSESNGTSIGPHLHLEILETPTLHIRGYRSPPMQPPRVNPLRYLNLVNAYPGTRGRA